jgi:ceramide glucosyltransferase
LTHHLSALAYLAIVAEAVLVTMCLSAIAYYVFAWYSARSFFSRAAERGGGFYPAVTILKPLRGLDREAYENFASFCRQNYPKYQIVFGADGDDEPAIAVARAVARDFPEIDIRIVLQAGSSAPNPKIGNLAGMVSEAKYPVLLISDSDIRVGPTHLKTMVQPMSDPRVGVVTCLYRSHAVGIAGALDALGLSTEFQPSVLVARQLEGISFAMGSGILIRKSVLDEMGGFEAVADYLADDYLLGHLPSKAGHRVELAHYVVEHRLDTGSFTELIHHQMRWNRGIRAARPRGYAGLVFTQGVPASLLLPWVTGGSAAGWILSGLTLASRMVMAWFVAVRCLEDPVAKRALWLVPLRDLLGFALWVSAFFGTTIVWRGTRFRLGERGKLLPAASSTSRTGGEAIAPTRAVS